jgi:hypothetical protein
MIIGNITENAPIVDLEATSKEVDIILRNEKNTEGLVVIKENKPVGIVVRSLFYQKIVNILVVLNALFSSYILVRRDNFRIFKFIGNFAFFLNV